MQIRKERLPKGMSYPLKSSALNAALIEAGNATKIELMIGPNHRYFEAYFWPCNKRVDHDRFYIRTGAVSSVEGGEARECMESRVLPDFIAWAQALLALPTNSPDRHKESYFWRDFRSGFAAD